MENSLVMMACCSPASRPLRDKPITCRHPTCDEIRRALLEAILAGAIRPQGPLTQQLLGVGEIAIHVALHRDGALAWPLTRLMRKTPSLSRRQASGLSIVSRFTSTSASSIFTQPRHFNKMWHVL
ncbi:hypothetical protein Thi970DRAFT_04596 [Thiorhodovibrio frisius]|uniref:Uncharacterized protein n=1 Tax=Thiorhodovibrio frisius TaxID=631362 RepID=H8Z7J1_9GAMM|nr:hypothetical protein Thi970DRAFT_04596 [Thiorhodovibrio frisius]WPL21980.1 hypothetical protein Thiofri_02122 [Thiorhodovibrio frisius]